MTVPNLSFKALRKMIYSTFIFLKSPSLFALLEHVWHATSMIFMIKFCFADSLVSLQIPRKLNQFLSIFVLPQFSAMHDTNVPNKCVLLNWITLVTFRSKRLTFPGVMLVPYHLVPTNVQLGYTWALFHNHKAEDVGCRLAVHHPGSAGLRWAPCI